MAALSTRLTNWARWTRGGSGQQQEHCVSAEHRYRPPRCFDEPEPQTFVDIADAMLVERAWRELPDVNRLALKLQWVKGFRWERQSGRLSEARYLAQMARYTGIAKARVVEFVQTSEIMLQKQLTLLEQQRILRY